MLQSGEVRMLVVFIHRALRKYHFRLEVRADSILPPGDFSYELRMILLESSSSVSSSPSSLGSYSWSSLTPGSQSSSTVRSSEAVESSSTFNGFYSTNWKEPFWLYGRWAPKNETATFSGANRFSPRSSYSSPDIIPPKIPDSLLVHVRLALHNCTGCSAADPCVPTPGIRSCSSVACALGAIDATRALPSAFAVHCVPFAREALLEARGKHLKRYRTQIESLDEVSFHMLSANGSNVRWQLDEVREQRPKFICLNDDMGEGNNTEAREAIQEFLEWCI